MKELIKKLTAIERQTSAERGEYDLFALFLREDSSNKWDILVSSNWISNNKEESLRYLAQKVQKELTPIELYLISRIVIIEKNDPALPTLQQAISGEHGIPEIKDSNLFGLQIKHAYLITSRRVQAA